jgi:membrane-bound lytic murein transglycosylase A
MSPVKIPSRMKSWRRAAAILAIGGMVAACVAHEAAFEPGRITGNAHVTLAPESFRQLPGWSGDEVAAAVPAFVKSCDRTPAQSPHSAPLDPVAADADFGRLGDWRPLCRLAARLPGCPPATTQRRGASSADGQYWVLLPKTVVARMVTLLN